MSAFQIKEERTGPVTLLRAAGRLILGDGPEALRATIDASLARGDTKLVLDMSAVTYVDSAGLGAVVSGFSTARTRGATLVLAGLTKRVADLLQMTKLLTVFETFPTADDAVLQLAAAPPGE